jgi:hypothetical protein
VAFVGKKLKGFRRYYFGTEWGICGAEPECNNTHGGMFCQIRQRRIVLNYAAKSAPAKAKPPFFGGFERTFCSVVVSGFFRDNWILNLTLVFLVNWIWFFIWILFFGF